MALLKRPKARIISVQGATAAAPKAAARAKANKPGKKTVEKKGKKGRDGDRSAAKNVTIGGSSNRRYLQETNPDRVHSSSPKG